ncbi:Hypothetical_protein [Hexamita inflata]|uniref:Hypothetical_protein n=1 Tax=Hexamita inflata TaxID=28002 RepID=A0AA86QCU2_9EUKA|nr:Hypothetical protein HINF_LOCUS42086 [Hexamita inflata]
MRHVRRCLKSNSKISFINRNVRSKAQTARSTFEKLSGHSSLSGSAAPCFCQTRSCKDPKTGQEAINFDFVLKTTSAETLDYEQPAVLRTKYTNSIPNYFQKMGYQSIWEIKTGANGKRHSE